LATELTEHDALAAHLDAELGFDPQQLTNPWHAAGASAASFTAGSLLPILAVALARPDFRIVVTALTVIAALGLTGLASAKLGGSRPAPAVVRLILGGGAAMGLTYLLGQLIGGNPL
jgi:VIT1/CCC1 family predicted Fe2+/Mn2+ transporter